MRKTRPEAAQHAGELAIGGKAKRSPNLRLYSAGELALPEDWEIKPGVPATRGDCRDGPRPCPYLRCRFHLWLQEAEARPGRRHLQERGGAPASALQPHTRMTCALDIAESGEKLTYAEIGALFGVSDERARVIAEKALAKLERLGYTAEDLMPPRAP